MPRPEVPRRAQRPCQSETRHPGRRRPRLARLAPLTGEAGQRAVEPVLLSAKAARRQNAITLTKEEDGATTNTYVATEDEPYILRVVTKGGDEPGDLTLADYDKPFGDRSII
ncbi:hypothetical protein QQY66_48450 [Streptomyces sp. DG2A-72]|uniref:hypothetical protein n=1 Tax=Streptomyces sp. DG2A-72 TaxID=3051386 RepID=UPI00265B7E2E|nr:hypothetical protein [Streptomyces sp. DG2A-72]MDO0939158.1 hypothetical protein [Streptomyces sp. DG2A-72]